jgi:capsular polysaccharide biosynthesis protein
MRADTPARRPLPDLDAEQEVDFGRYWRALVARWWLAALGIVVGAIIGALVSLGGSSSYEATAQVYLGQPLAPGGAATVIPVPTTLGLVANVVESESTIRQVAARVGLKPARLRGHIKTKPITGITGAKLGTPAPLIAITVSGSPPGKIAAAANALADVVIKQVAPYQSTKIATLKEQLAYDTAQLAAVNDRLAAARATQAKVLADKTISPTDKLVSLANLNSVITQALAQQVGLAQDRFGIRQQLTLAQDIELSRIVSPAAAEKAAGPSRRTAVVIGAFIGLIVGILAALVWEPLAVRVRPAQ